MNNKQDIRYNDTEEVSIDERMEMSYLPKVVSNSLDRKTDGLGEK